MSVTKNKFQDIFETGSRKLEELSRDQHESLSDGAEAHLASSHSLQQASIEELQKHAEEFDAEIEDRVQQSLRNIEKAIDTETSKIKKHTALLIDKFAACVRGLEDSITQQKYEHEYTLNTLSEDFFCLGEHNFEEAASDIAKHNLSTSQNLKAQNVFATNSFQQRMDHNLVEIHGEEKQITNKLFKTSLQVTNTIDNHLSSLSQKLSEKFDSSAQHLESIFQTGVTQLKKQMEELILNAETLSTERSQQMRESFETKMTELKAFSQQSSATCIEELQSTFEASKTDLFQTLEQLTQDLEEYTKATALAVESNSNAVCTKIGDSTESLTNDLDKRIEAAVELHQDLDTLKTQIIDGLKQDLLGTQAVFEESLADTAARASDDLKLSYSNAELAIKSLTDSSDLELKSMAGKAKSQIELTVLAFLDRVRQCRDAAVTEVKRAAGSMVSPELPSTSQDNLAEGDERQ